MNNTDSHKLTFRITGLDCPSCAAGVEKSVLVIPRVQSAYLSYASSILAVEIQGRDNLDGVVDDIVKAVKKSGHGVLLPEDDESNGANSSKKGKELLFTAMLILSGAAICIALATSLLVKNERVETVSWIVAVIAGLVIIIPKAMNSIRVRSLDINILMLVAVIGAVALRDFGEASVVIFLFSIGNVLESKAMSKTRDSIKDLMNLTPQMAHVKRDGAVYDLLVEDVSIGDCVTARPGERIPLDGVITSGSASIDESSLTGESVPVFKKTGDQVFAGTVPVNGAIFFEVTASVENSTLARVVDFVEKAQESKSPYETFIDRFASKYTPIVLILAVVVAVVPPLISLFSPFNIGDFPQWITRSLVLLVISCPCALVISTPVSIVSALTRAARDGVLVKGGSSLEIASSVTTIAYDKTGTLTKGKPRVVEVISYAAVSTTELLVTVAALEQNSTHPLARAIVSASEEATMIEEGIPQLPETHDFVEVAGRGLRGVVEGRAVFVGSPEFAEEVLSAPLEHGILERIKELQKDVFTILVVVINREVAGLIALRDTIRDEAKSSIQALRDEGITRHIMLTGDNERSAEQIASELQLDDYRAKLLPQNKGEALLEMRTANEVVAMVGDGINDAPALAVADIGVAMGGIGSDVAINTADVVLMADDLETLPRFFRLAKKTMSIVRQNVLISLSVKFTVLILALLGIANLWLAVFADTGIALVVIANGIRLLKKARKQ